MSIRVIVVEDDAPTAAALCQSLRRSPDLLLVGVAHSHPQASVLLQQSCDLALIDLDLHGVSSLDLIARLSEQQRCKIMVISALGDETSVMAAIEAGAEGYLLKDGAFADLETPILQLMQGQAPISPGVARHLLRRCKPQATKAPVTSDDLQLTPREQEVLRHFALGASYKEVAQQLQISLHTVRDHVKALYRKLQAHSRGVAVRRAVQCGILHMPD